MRGAQLAVIGGRSKLAVRGYVFRTHSGRADSDRGVAQSGCDSVGMPGCSGPTGDDWRGSGDSQGGRLCNGARQVQCACGKAVCRLPQRMPHLRH
eukprot:546263-Rhodomonas_salina.9